MSVERSASNVERSASRGAVFLSYASQDAEAVRRIAEALRDAGVEVWFDQNELVGGDVWDVKIRGQIASCALFVPVISSNTQARLEGYFRLEWKLAAQRTHTMAEEKTFLLPVVIDATRDAEAKVLAEFKAVQWSRLPGGEGSEKFCARVKKLLDTEATVVAGGADSGPASARPATPKHGGSRPWVVRAIVAGAMLAAIAGFLFWRKAAPASGGAASAAIPAKPVVNDKSIAVLPFANRSPDPENAFFTDGIHEDILTNLFNIRELRVVSRTSVEQYRGTTKSMKQIGAELEVAFLLEGSVQRVGNKVRVTGQLIDARSDRPLWSRSYDKDLSDVFAIQAELAKAIASELQAVISPREKSLMERRPTENVAAYDAYLRARETQQREGTAAVGMRRREVLLRDAVERDPNFAVAWVELAYVHGLTYRNNLDHSPARIALARAAIDTAAGLAPDAPETIRGLGDYYLLVVRDYDRAAAQYEKFARLQPRNALAYYSIGNVHRRLGQWAECVANYHKAVALEPTNFNFSSSLRQQLEVCRRFDEAIVEQRRSAAFRSAPVHGYNLALLSFQATGSTREMDAFFSGLPAEQAISRSVIALRLRWAQARGDFAEAVRLDRADDDPETSSIADTLEAALALAASGDTEAARARLRDWPVRLAGQLEGDQENAVLWANLGMVEALLGHKAEALRCVDKAMAILPVSRDSFEGPRYAMARAFVYAWTGEKESALREYAGLLRGVGYAQWGFNVHLLKNGAWAFPLRGDPRFQALLDDPKNNAPLF